MKYHVCATIASKSGHKAVLKQTIPATATLTEQIMRIRYPLTVLTLAAILMAGGAAIAGGMPSDEGPEVVPEEMGFLGGDNPDEDTIAAIIKSLPPERLPAAYVPTAYDVAATITEATDTTLISTPKLPPALTSPVDDWKRDHR